MPERTHPKRIGPYRILELKGEGAWGLVYLAEQEEPVRRKVAVKVLKRGVDTDEVLARFAAERQAMALMSHPNIAQILDAGATDQGLSYFVMEYVAGESINEYCDRHKLSVRDRVELFQRVCEAIQHAHQKGIIHRDLKPTNVLVAHVEGRAVPKVIDFGIAKAMHQRLTDKTLYTTQGQFIGTPGYMSPEQALQGVDIDTTTDIYALGAMLYELLTGVLPLDIRLLDMELMLKTLRESDPPTLRDRLTQMGERGEKVAKARGVDLRALKRTLSGDLKWVVTRALEKDPTRRYQAASELAAELGRYLRNEAVLAGPPGTTYQLKKFVSRNKGPVVVAAMLVALLSGFSVAMTVQVQRANRGETQAQLASETAEQVSEFLVGLFEVSDPSESLGNTITAREILDQGAERIETELADQPIVQARLMHTMGSVYQGLGLLDQAASLLEQAVAVRELELGEEHVDVAESVFTLALLYGNQGKYVEAEPLYLRALAIREEALGPDHPDVVISLRGLAFLYWTQGAYAQAEPLYLRAVAIGEEALGSDHPDVALSVDLAASLNSLALLYWRQGDYGQAEALLLRRVAIEEEALGPEHPDVGLNNLAFLYMSQGKYAEAEPLYVRALANKEKALGPEHPDVARSLNNLALLYYSQDKYAEAEPLYVRALANKEKALGPEHPDLVIFLNNLARLYHNQRRYAEAEALYVRALAIGEEVLGPEHREVARSLHNVALLYDSQGKYAEAESLYVRALGILEALDPDHPRVASTLHELGGLYTTIGKYAEAEPLLVRALDILEKALGPDHPGVAETLEAYADLLRQMGRVQEAEPMEERAAAIRAASGN